MTAWTGVLAALLLLSGRAAAAEAPPDAGSCLACHGSADAGAPVVDAAAFAVSRHAPSACVGCHADIKEYPHPEKVLKEWSSASTTGSTGARNRTFSGPKWPSKVAPKVQTP